MNKKKISDEENAIFNRQNLEDTLPYFHKFMRLAKKLDMTYQDLVVVAGGMLRISVRFSVKASKKEGVKVTKKDKDIFMQELGEYIMK